MSEEKGWRDYWEKYGPPINELKFPKIEISNKIHILLIASLLAVVVLCFINFRTGRYTAVLNSDISEMENKLSTCGGEVDNASSSLGTCEADLAVCLSNVTSKLVALETCESEKEEESCPSPDVCQERYIKLKENYVKDLCCKDAGVYKSYDFSSNLEVDCRTDENGLFLLEC